MLRALEATGNGVGGGLALIGSCGLGSEAFPPECLCLCLHTSMFLLLHEDGSRPARRKCTAPEIHLKLVRHYFFVPKLLHVHIFVAASMHEQEHAAVCYAGISGFRKRYTASSI